MSLMSETEVAKRWKISPKTLQRWRTDRYGPTYVKLGKNVRYRSEDIEAYEISQRAVTRIEPAKWDAKPLAVTSVQESVDPPDTPVASDPHAVEQNFIGIAEAIRITNLPAYYFGNAAVRAQLKIPFYTVGRKVRFKPGELCHWLFERERAAEAERNRPLEAPTPEPAPRKMRLREALRLHNGGNVLR